MKLITHCGSLKATDYPQLCSPDFPEQGYRLSEHSFDVQKQTLAERIRVRIEETTANDRRGVFKEPITVSIGVSGFVTGISKNILIRQADIALYWAKNNGRNRSHVFNPELERDYEIYCKK